MARCVLTGARLVTSAKTPKHRTRKRFITHHSSFTQTASRLPPQALRSRRIHLAGAIQDDAVVPSGASGGNLVVKVPPTSAPMRRAPRGPSALFAAFNPTSRAHRYCPPSRPTTFSSAPDSIGGHEGRQTTTILVGRKPVLKVGFGNALLAEWNRTIVLRRRQDQEGSRTSRFSATIRLMLRIQARSSG